MNIYKLNYKKLRRQMTLFMKTIYGKIVFILAYSIPIIFTVLFLMVTSDLKIYYQDPKMIYFLVGVIYLLLVAILLTFIIGTVYFYKELKGFILSHEKK